MISPKTQTNLANAKTYFEDHLTSGDYYSQGKQTRGTWFGKAAEELGLQGAVEEDAFLAMCEGINPNTGETLTARKNTTRLETHNGETREVANRRTYYDFTLSPPKSVSVAALVGNDDRIIEAHKQAIDIAIGELETFAAVRVRSAVDPLNGKDRLTGNMVAAVFHHETSRAVAEGIAPDPHLRSHVLVFNATQDAAAPGQNAASGREEPDIRPFRALQNFEMLRAQKYVDAVYYHELSRRLHQFGYETETTKTGFEISGIAEATRERFSKRHDKIQELTAQLIANGARRNEKDLAFAVAHDSRVRKQPHHSAELLRSDWLDQMPEKERSALDQTLARAAEGEQVLDGRPPPNYEKAFDWADRHHFERKSVVYDVALWTDAIRELRGTQATVPGLKEHFAARAYVRDQDGRRVTTPETLAREQRLIAMVQVGKGQYEPLINDFSDVSPTLNDGQKKTVETLAASRDFLSVFRDGAGTGKSFTLGELNRLLTAEGQHVVAVAPQNTQVQDLEKGGFSNARTLASSLQGHDVGHGSVILLDEAGQVGGSDFLKLLVLAKENGCRVIASGDTRQHGAVTATDALVAIQRYAQPTVAWLPATTSTIQRQQAPWYRKAVAAADAGLPTRAFQILEANRAVLDVTIRDKHADVAKAFCQRSSDGGTCLVVTQTNAEVDLLNEAIRKELIEKDRLGSALLRLAALRPLDLTSAQKLQPQQYAPNTVIIANRKVAGFENRSRFKSAQDDSIVVADDSGVEHVIRGNQLDRITVCEEKELEFRNGEQIQIKANLKTKEGLRLPNGAIVTLQGVDPETGDIHIQDRQDRLLSLDPSVRMLQYGYASTSYGSQGKTVDHVLISDSQCKAATNQKEFYVSISRGRQSVAIYTTDREALRDHVQRLGDRELALDLEAERGR